MVAGGGVRKKVVSQLEYKHNTESPGHATWICAETRVWPPVRRRKNPSTQAERAFRHLYVWYLITIQSCSIIDIRQKTESTFCTPTSLLKCSKSPFFVILNKKFVKHIYFFIMEKSVFWSLYRTLSHQEARKLLEFVESPYFNTQEDLVKAIRYFNECRFFLGTVPTKESTHKKVFRQMPYEDQRVRTILSNLKKLTEQFLVVQNLLQEGKDFQLQLASIVRQRGLNKHFKKEIAVHQKRLEKSPLRDAHYLRHRFLNRQEYYHYYSVRRETQEINMATLIEELDQAYYAELFRLACVQVSYRAFMDDPSRDQQMIANLEFIRNKGWERQPAIGAYYHTYLALTNPQEATHFQKLKALLFDRAEAFSPRELRDLFLLAINFCIKRYNEGNKMYLSEEFELFKEGFRRDLFLQEGYLSPFSFRNTVTLALILKEYKWLESFISTYGPALPPDQRQNLKIFSQARLAYGRKDYGLALQLLSQTDYSDLLLSLSAKSLQIKVYHALGEEELLDYHLKAMRVYIQRKKVMGYHREHFLNLVNFTQKMLEIAPFHHEKKDLLLQQVRETRRVAEKAWLLEVLQNR